MKNGKFPKSVTSFIKHIKARYIKKQLVVPQTDFVKVQDTSIPNHFSWVKVLNKKTSGYINNENRYSDGYFSGNKKEIKEVTKFFEKLHANLTNGLESVNESYGSYIYSYKTISGKERPILFRSNLNTKEVVVEQNVLSAETGFLSVGELRVSPNEQFVAVAFDFSGLGKYDCCVMKPAEKSQHVGYLVKLENVSSYEWASDDFLLYTELDVKTLRSSKLYKYVLSTGEKRLLCTEYDPRYSMHISKSKSVEKLLLNISSKVNSEVWLLGKDGALDQLLCSRDQEKESSIDHFNDTFYNLTEDADKEYCVKFMIDSDTSKTWKDFVKRTNETEFISDMVLFQHQLILLKTNNVIPRLSIYPGYQKEKCIDFQVADTPGHLEVENEEGGDIVNVSFTSPIKPLMKYKIETKTRTVRECSNVLPSWNTEEFEHRSIFIDSKDGARVPVSLFYKKDIDLSSAPMLCRVYGSYGVSVSLRFSEMNAYLLSKGWILMYPHVRGGQELGRKWYLSSRLHGKHSTFYDLEYSLAEMHKRKISSPQKTALYGKSAGGLPIAWLLNNSPRLCSAAVMEVPFISVLHTMLNENNQLTTQEYMEWGNPRKVAADLKYISSYCPYHNMKVSENDPAVLVHLSMHDSIVPHWVPLQWVAKRRHLLHALHSDNNGHDSKPLLCRVNMKGGHFGYDVEIPFQKDAEIVAFLKGNIGN